MLVISLDPPFGHRGEKTYREIVLETREYASYFKIGLPLVLEEGLSAIGVVKELTSKPVIVDFKLADIGEIMSYVAEKLAERGVDAIIAHGFIGVEESLDKLVDKASKYGLKVILVASMSHKGSRRYIDLHFEEIVKDALELGVYGIVAPATRPWIINRARELSQGKLKIFSPGIGAQGGKPGTGICAGADYEIIGRLITRSENPGLTAERILEELHEAWRRCRG